jgi:hypothetical protein
MKTFIQHLTEASKTTENGFPIEQGIMAGNLNDDSVVERLNAFVGAIADREYLVPEHAVEELRQKLHRVGIDFGDVQFTGESGEVSVPLTMFGGVYGKDTDSKPEEIVNETESGRTLNFTFEKVAGSHKVYAQIV